MKLKSFVIAVVLSAWGQISYADNVYTIYPIPQQQVAVDGTVNFSTHVNAILETGIDQATKNRLIQVLKEHGVTATFSNKPVAGQTNIYLGVNNSSQIVDKKATELQLNRDVFNKNKFDRHILSVFNNKGFGQILILGENTDATFFGLASLEQILDAGLQNKPCVNIYDYADIKSRGVIEGYYGVPYSVAVTKDLLRFMMRYKMNSYMYGAKSDPYHSQKWEAPYPTSITPAQEKLGLLTQDMLKSITDVSHETKVNFIWAIHPGGAFTNANDKSVISKIMDKFTLMHNLGVRQFGVFVDDIGVPNDEPTLKLNADRLTELQNKMDAKWNYSGATATDTVKPLHFVPQLYAYAWANKESRNKFFGALSQTPSKVQIYITGANVWSVPNTHDLEVVKDDLGRDVAWWWNYPCNDNADAQIFSSSMYDNFFDMPAIDNNARLPKELDYCSSLLSNPMQEGEISKIPLFSVADFAWNNSGFENTKSWEAATKAVLGQQYGSNFRTLAPYFRWNDPNDLERLIANYKTSKNSTELYSVLNKLIEASNQLLTIKDSSSESDQLFYHDIRPWLMKLNKTAILTKELMEVSVLPNNAPNKWERYQKAAAQVDSLTASPLYNIEALEGMGGGIVVETYNVKLAQRHLTPFMNELKEHALDGFWAQVTEPTIVSDLPKTHARVIFDKNTGKGYISLSSGVNLDEKNFIGVEFPTGVKLSYLFIEDALFNNFTPYYSINGKKWNKLSKGKTPEDYVKYIVFQNLQKGEKNLILHNGNFYFQYPQQTPLAKAEMPEGEIYDGHIGEKYIDKDLFSFACLKRNQKADDAYTITLKDKTPIHDVRVYMGTTNGDYMNEGYVQVSSNGRNWVTLKIKGTNNYKYTMDLPEVKPFNKDTKYTDFDGRNLKAKYVRLFVTKPNTHKWLRLYEIEVNHQNYLNQFQSTAINGNGSSIDILTDTKGDVYAQGLVSPVTYQLQNMQQTESFTVYQSPNGVTMNVEVQSEDGEWKSIGTITSEYEKTFDLKAYKDAKAVRLSWEGNKMPLIYELSEQQSNIKPVVNKITYINNNESLKYNITDGSLFISGLKDVASLFLTNLEGKCLYKKINLNGEEVAISFNGEGNGSYILSLIDHKGETKSYKIYLNK